MILTSHSSFMSYPSLLVILLFLMLHLSACTPSPEPSNETGVSLELAEFRKSLISDVHYTLFFNIPEDQENQIEATATISFNLEDGTANIPLDFRESVDHLKSLSINGRPADILFENEHIILSSENLSAGENVVDIEFIAGESSLNRNPEYLYTLFVPDRARTAFPLFDQPDLKAIFELTLEIPKTWEALSNARLESTTEKISTKVLEFAPSDLFSSYLFSFVAGEFKPVTRTVDGVEMTMLHRETDTEKVERNLNDIFELHASSLDWLEEYTGIDYPFQKFDFALIPSFQYGGMEHTGAILYRAESLFLDEDPSESQLLSRASLIAHETAHMWFGNLVTMKWFNDVWTKEVFANFMAAKIVNPSFPNINHDLNFLLRHHPSSYSVDRTDGANPIRQQLDNLNEAGQMYGAIIYNKAPIMMRQLELIVGEETFKEGMREYLETFSFENATWPELIEILDRKTENDLTTWSEVWVNTPGRPHFTLDTESNKIQIVQNDPLGEGRTWPQTFSILELTDSDSVHHSVTFEESAVPFEFDEEATYIFNSDGYGYGLFPTSLHVFSSWNRLDDRTKGAELVNLFENVLEQTMTPAETFSDLKEVVQTEENQLLLNRALSHLETLYWNLLSEDKRNEHGPQLENILWEQIHQQEESSRKRLFFNTFKEIAITDEQVDKLHDIWSGELEIAGLNLSETDYISLAGNLAVKRADQAEQILSAQLEKIEDGDRKRRFEFIMPALSPDQNERDAFFESLKEVENRQTESWVLSALGYLHHPLRTDESEKYLYPSLELLQEIQVTGDIFFPSRWLDATFSNHSSDNAVKTVRDFLEERPDYNPQLRMKILQSADMMFRANEILR